jgi:DNA-binding protein H-NS
MNDFLKILTHGLRLQGATNSLSIKELRDVVTKLEIVIEKRIEQEAVVAQQKAEKLAQIEKIREQMIAAGLDISDFNATLVTPSKKGNRRKGAKRPIKYSITVNGSETKWTGIGRMPLVFSHALENGATLDEFLIKK